MSVDSSLTLGLLDEEELLSDPTSAELAFHYLVHYALKYHISLVVAEHHLNCKKLFEQIKCKQ